MEGYEVITPEDDKVGRVVETKGEYLIVEQGHLFKSRHAVPRMTVEVDEGEQQVRTTLSKRLIETSPKVDDGSFDEQAVAAHYGLGTDAAAPGTEGYGETLPTDPATSAEGDAIRAGVETPAEQRARTQKGEAGSGLPEESPGLLGDRLAGIDEREQKE